MSELDSKSSWFADDDILFSKGRSSTYKKIDPIAKQAVYLYTPESNISDKCGAEYLRYNRCYKTTELNLSTEELELFIDLISSNKSEVITNLMFGLSSAGGLYA